MKVLYMLPLITTFSLIGCGSESNTSPKPSAQEASPTSSSQATTKSQTGEPKAETYQSSLPADAPTYKVATTGTQPPYSFTNKDGILQGIDIEVIRLIGEEQGFHVEFYKEPWQNIFPSVVNNKRDMAISGISYNDERNTKYLLSKSYLFVPSALMYKDKDLNIKKLQDLEGLRFVGMTGSKQLNDVKKNVSNVELSETKTMFQAYQDLIQGKADAIAEDIHWLQFMAKSYPEHDMKIVPYETRADLSSQQIIMFKKGNDKLAQSVNEGIDKLIASGKIDEIEKKWVGE